MGEGKANISTHVFLHIHPRSTSPDAISCRADLVNNRVLAFTGANEADVAPKIGERQGHK